MFSIIVVPAAMFICGNHDVISHSRDNPNEYGKAILIITLWLMSMITNLVLPHVKKYLVYEDNKIKPGTWHSQTTIEEQW
jgi:hypothetical protein